MVVNFSRNVSKKIWDNKKDDKIWAKYMKNK